MIFNKIYIDDAERMIGDIDFLYDRKDTCKLKVVLKKNGYFTNKNINFSPIHLDKKIKENRLFAIEAHHSLLIRDKTKLPAGEFLKNVLVLNKICVPEINQMFLNNIYENQINDHGYKKLNYIYRHLYDSYLMLKSEKINNQFNKDKYINNYMNILNSLLVSYPSNFKLRKSHFNSFRIKMRKRSKIFMFYEREFIRIIIFAELLPLKLYGFLTKRNYRKKFIQKYLKINQNLL